jgi:diguanylate cyclase (GGDEF)-like protein
MGGTSMRAREPESAARSGVLILLVAAAVVAAFNLFQPLPYSTWATAAAWAAVGVIVLAATLVRVLPAALLDRLGAYTLIAVGGVLLTCGLNVVTQDASAASQAFLAFPVLWSASHLHRGAVVLVTATAVIANGVSLLVLLPVEAALTDLVFFGAVLVVMAVMLVRASAVQERLVVALREQARHDSLTGLVNRRVFDETLEETLTRRWDGGMALILIDVDSFKTINDSHGHPVGDDVLVHLADILRDEVRADDAVLSRLGGDELAVLLPGCTAPVAARRAQELLDAVRDRPLRLPDGRSIALSISLGVAHVARGGASLRALYSSADGALYEAKRAGRGRVALTSA